MAKWPSHRFCVARIFGFGSARWPSASPAGQATGAVLESGEPGIVLRHTFPAILVQRECSLPPRRGKDDLIALHATNILAPYTMPSPVAPPSNSKQNPSYTMGASVYFFRNGTCVLPVLVLRAKRRV